MNNKYYGKKYIRERLTLNDGSEKRFYVSAYDDRTSVGEANTLDKTIDIAKDYFRAELESHPDLLYNYDKNDDNCNRFLTITDTITEEECNISIEDLAKYIIIKKIVGNIGKIG